MSDSNQPESTENGDLAEFFSENDQRDTSIADDDAQIGQRLTDARVSLGDSIADVAERLGVTAEDVEGWESGDVPLRANHLNKVAGVLGISLSWLIMGRGAEPIADLSDIGRIRADLAAARSRLDDVVNELAVFEQRLAQLDEA